jgi:hypothetical protein
MLRIMPRRLLLDEWQQLMVYCSTCQNWRDTLPHEECMQGSTDSALLLDHGRGFLTCTACQQIWLMGAIEAVCPVCNQPQQIAFYEDTVQLQPDDQLLAVEGTLAYIRLQSGTLVITDRTCLAIGDT